jgi:hypothetical protein
MFKRKMLFFVAVLLVYVLAFILSLFHIYNCFRDTDCIVFDQIKKNSVVNR